MPLPPLPDGFVVDGQPNQPSATPVPPSGFVLDGVPSQPPQTIDDLEKIMQTRDLTPAEQDQYIQLDKNMGLGDRVGKFQIAKELEGVGSAVAHPIDTITSAATTAGKGFQELFNDGGHAAAAAGAGTGVLDAAKAGLSEEQDIPNTIAHYIAPDAAAKADLARALANAAYDRGRATLKATVGNPNAFETGAVLGQAALAPEDVGEAAAGTAEAAKSGLKAMFESNPDAPATSQAMKAVAGQLYQEAADQGGVLSPQFTNKFLDTISGKPPETPTEVIAAKSDPVKLFAEEYSPIRNQPMSLSDAQLIDERLGDQISAQYGPNGLSKQGRNLLEAQSTLRDMIDNASPSDIVGGSQGFDALENARAAWSQAMKMGDLEKIQTRAEYSDNPATTIKSGARALLSNPSRVRGYSEEELNALKNAATTGVGTNVLRVFGSRLIPIISGSIGGVVGGAPGAVVAGGAAHVASSVARNVASGAQGTKLQNVLNVMGRKQQFENSLNLNDAIRRNRFSTSINP